MKSQRHSRDEVYESSPQLHGTEINQNYILGIGSYLTFILC